MPFSARRAPSLVAVASLVAGIALNVAIGVGAQALTAPGTAPTMHSSAVPQVTEPAPVASATPVISPTPTPTPLPEPTADALSRTSGGTAARTTVVLRGRAMANVARVVVGNRDAEQLTLLAPTELRFVVPEADGFVPGTAAISLVSATDHARIGTRFTWTYVVRTGVDREMAYAATHWNLHSSTRFGYIPKNDCVNFTSQLLLARGWRQSADWWNDGPVSHTETVKKTVLVPTKVTVVVPAGPAARSTSKPTAEPTGRPTAGATGRPAAAVTPKPAPGPGKAAPTRIVKTVLKKVVTTVKKVVTTVDASAPWVSSTAMSDWLASRPDLATRVSYRDRAAVRIGDIVQFDWSGAGSSWDHTAVVSRIVVGPGGAVDIWYAEHTNHQLYGGSIGTLFKSAEYAHMTVQFWRLRH
ncbi:MAG: hypothetical protein ACTHJL_02710 [Amnibacterium sp.]